jgi:hypothetical protein
MRELSLETNMPRQRGIHRVCPRCGKVGILTRKWGAQVYYPQISSVYVDLPHAFERGYVTGERYRGLRHVGITNSETFDKKSSYKVRYSKYQQWCIAHYESGGRRWQCSLRKGIIEKPPKNKDERNKIDFILHHFDGRLPSLQKPEKRNYQRKKDFRYRDRLSEKISEIKNNGTVLIRVHGKRYPLYMF